ncbi:MAG: branched-chain amino acid ABC transporter permease [Actinobacteria bacterium]|nr:MAG: branched-chain amino acid ABC transporter permease [Actinomycetota bacterium]
MDSPQVLVSPGGSGCFFGMLALAYHLIYVGAGFFNFAIGPYAMMGGLCTSWLVITYDLGVWTAATISVIVTLILAIVTELGVVRPVQKRSGSGELPALVAVAAVLFAIQQLAGYVFGYPTLPGQSLATFGPVTIGDVTIQPSSVLMIVIAVVTFVVTAFWIRFTRTGRLLRAVGDSNHAAALLGLPVNRIRLIAFLVAGFIAALAGILFAPKAGVHSLSGLAWSLSGFLAMVVGGTGSVWAPLLGGMLLGLVEVFLPYYFGGQAHVYGMLVIALIFFAFKPQGLFVRTVRA